MPGQHRDLIVTLDDATPGAFFVEQEGTASSFQAMAEVIGGWGLPPSLYTGRDSHYWHTPRAGGKVDRLHRTRFGRAMHQFGVEPGPHRAPRRVRSPCGVPVAGAGRRVPDSSLVARGEALSGFRPVGEAVIGVERDARPTGGRPAARANPKLRVRDGQDDSTSRARHRASRNKANFRRRNPAPGPAGDPRADDAPVILLRLPAELARRTARDAADRAETMEAWIRAELAHVFDDGQPESHS